MSKTEMSQRLRFARSKAGFRTAEDFLKANPKISPSTYRAHEQGDRNFTSRGARVYASLFSCDAVWLYTGSGGPGTIEEQEIKNAIVAGGHTVALEKVSEICVAERRMAPAVSVAGKTPFLIAANLTFTAKPGWVVYTEEPIKKGIEKLYGLPCWVETEEGETLVCEVLRGYTEGKHNLMCFDSSFKADVTLKVAAKIYAILPIK